MGLTRQTTTARRRFMRVNGIPIPQDRERILEGERLVPEAAPFGFRATKWVTSVRKAHHRESGVNGDRNGCLRYLRLLRGELPDRGKATTITAITRTDSLVSSSTS